MFSGPRERLDAAESPETPLEVLRDLAASEHEFVHSAVARHRHADESLLRALVPAAIRSSREAEIAIALGSNPRAPADALGRLAVMTAPELGKPREAPWAFELGVLLCRHPATPEEAIRCLLFAEGAVTQFRKVVARESTRADVRALLETDRSEIVRRTLARRDPNGEAALDPA